MIPMDAVLIEQVTINLLENAIVHSGSILPIDFIVEDHPEHVSFIVRDYGKGLSEEKLQNLFETGTYNNSQSSDSRKHGYRSVHLQDHHHRPSRNAEWPESCGWRGILFHTSQGGS